MAEKLTGSVVLQRIYEYIAANPENIRNLEILGDIKGLPQAAKASISDIEAALIHNNFAEIQGGVAGEYFHLSQAELEGILNGIIYQPSAQPQIVLGTPNELNIDLGGYTQGDYEPRLDGLTQAINVDFDLILDNETGVLTFAVFFRFSGTRIITMPVNVKVSVPSSIGTWVAPNLTLTTGTDDDILMVFHRNKTGGFWDLSVNEVSV